jgi:hypothetical protein
MPEWPRLSFLGLVLSGSRSETTNLNCSETYNHIILSSETLVLSSTHNRLASGSARPAKARATAASAFAQVTRYYQIGMG